MRHLTYGILIGLLLAAPAMAQTAASDSKTAPAAPQQQPAKDSKDADQPAKTGQAAASEAPAQAGRTDSMSDYNVLGNAVGDGLGVSR